MSSVEVHPPAVDDGRERRAIGWLTLGLLLGPIGLTVGWYHVLTAPRWSWRDKTVAALLPAPLVGIPMFGRAGLDAETCRQSDAGAITCAAHPLAGVLEWVVPIALLVVLAWMIRHLSEAARGVDAHPVASRWTALVAAVAMAVLMPVLGDRVEDVWSHRERDAVVDAAAAADEAGERYAVVGETTASDWTSDSDARPDEQEMARLVGPGNRRFDRLFAQIAAGGWDVDDGPDNSRADEGACHVFPVVPGEGSTDVEDATELIRLCHGPSERTTSLTLDTPGRP